MKQTGLQNQSQRAQKDFHSCPATSDFNAEDHLQAMFVECIPVDPVSNQKQKKKRWNETVGQCEGVEGCQATSAPQAQLKLPEHSAETFSKWDN